MSQLELLAPPSADARVAHETPLQIARSARVVPRRLWVKNGGAARSLSPALLREAVL